jgi:hypothetical protein
VPTWVVVRGTSRSDVSEDLQACVRPRLLKRPVGKQLVDELDLSNAKGHDIGTGQTGLLVGVLDGISRSSGPDAVKAEAQTLRVFLYENQERG